MAIQILPGGTRSSMLGQSLGLGLGQGLQTLLQNKIDSMLMVKQRNETASGLQALGFPDEAAAQISMLPKDLQGLVVKNYLSGAESAGLDQALSSLSGGQPQGMESLPGQQQELTPEQANMQPNIASQAQVSKAPMDKFKAILSNPRLRPEHRLRIEQMAQQERLANKRLQAQEDKQKSLELKEIDKENKPVISEINKKAKSAIDDNRRLKKMESLIAKGNLTRPGFHTALKTLSKGIFGLGIDLHYLESADSQEFTKLTNEFLKGAKDIFGSRITNFDAETYLKMIPSLSQSKEGKLQVLNNIKIANEANRMRKDAMDQIIKENNGRAPRNLESLIEDKVGPELDELAKIFKKGASNKLSIPKADIVFDKNKDIKKEFRKAKLSHTTMKPEEPTTNPFTYLLDSMLGKG